MHLELEKYFDSFHDKFWKRYHKEVYANEVATSYDNAFNGNLAAGGNLSLSLTQNRTDKVLDITRIIINIDGATPGAPVLTAGSYWWLFYGSQNSFNLSSVFDFMPNAPQTFIAPSVREYGENQAPILAPGESIAIQMAGLTGNVGNNVTVSVHGYFQPRKDQKFF